LSRCSQQRIEKSRQTRISSQIIQTYGVLSFEMPYLLWISEVCFIAFPVVMSVIASSTRDWE